ncbi:MAG: chlororespiratory reduction protein 7 [Pseudanabaenaceae cyanobacterium bins.68]|nr:chlororespiratory reduction protein 7 [Pseudanabaenaceae cyanobacterium bins.68]
MPDSIMYYQEDYVLLPPDLQPRFVKLPELREVLGRLLPTADLPKDLAKLSSPEQQITNLLETACELECQDGTWQWYVVRLDK